MRDRRLLKSVSDTGRWLINGTVAVSLCLLAACHDDNRTTGVKPGNFCALSLPPGTSYFVRTEPSCSTRSDTRLHSMSDEGILLTSELDLPPGRYALPDTGEPTQLVVMFHGHQQSSCAWRDHLRAVAERGAIAVAMDYSDQEDVQTQDFGFVENWGWAVRSGAFDSVLAVQYFMDRYPSIREVFNFGTSMGGNVSGFASYAQGAARADCTPIWDYWVATEGVHNLSEEYVGARSLAGVNETAAQAVVEIEEENGGTIEEVPDRYTEISTITFVDQLDYLKGAVLTHGSNDQTVPVDQSLLMATALQGQGVPARLYVVLGSDHVWEGDGDAQVMRIGLDELFRLMDGGEVSTGQTIVPGP